VAEFLLGKGRESGLQSASNSRGASYIDRFWRQLFSVEECLVLLMLCRLVSSVEPVEECAGFLESAGDFVLCDMVLYAGSLSIVVLGWNTLCAAWSDQCCQFGMSYCKYHRHTLVYSFLLGNFDLGILFGLHCFELDLSY
jgi:hypothetical protein